MVIDQEDLTTAIKMVWMLEIKMKYLTGNYEARDVLEVAGEVKVEERSNADGGLASLVKKHAFSFGVGVIGGIIWYGPGSNRNTSDLYRGTMEMVSTGALTAVGLTAGTDLWNRCMKEETFPLKIPSTLLGLLVGSVVGRYWLR